MIYKERLKIISIIITLAVRAECNFIEDLHVSIQNLQASVDKISLENAKTMEKFDQLQSDVTIMKEANSKSFESVDEKFDQLKADIKSQSSRINTNLEKSFNEKFSSTSHSILSLDNMIQTIEAKVDASSDAISLGKASKKSDFYHFGF